MQGLGENGHLYLLIQQSKHCRDVRMWHHLLTGLSSFTHLSLKISKQNTKMQGIRRTSKSLRKWPLWIHWRSINFRRRCWAFQIMRAKLERDLCSFLMRKGSRTETDIKRKVKDFFLSDDVSSITTGRKQTMTRLKNKMHKRLLTDNEKIYTEMSCLRN